MCAVLDATSGTASEYCRYSVGAGAWPVGSTIPFQPGDRFEQTGYYRLAAGGTDAAGNPAPEQVRYFKIDAAAPLLQLSAGAPLGWTKAATLTATGADGESGLASLWCTTESGEWTSGAAACSQAFTHPGTLRYYGLDRAGNRAPASGSYTVPVTVIDDQAPAITLDVMAGASELGAQAAGNDVVVSWAVSDAGSGVASQELRLWSRTMLVGTCTTLPTCTFRSTPGGAGVLRAAAADQVGNQASAEQAIEVQARTFLTHLPAVLRQAGDQPEYPDLVVTDAQVRGSSVQVTIRNQGSAPAATSFWVDLYLNPSPPPAGVNQVWSDGRCRHGMVWGVDEGRLPLDPGASLTLTQDMAAADYTSMPWPIPAGQTVYVQVDSASQGSGYGAVLESHEATGGAYNNILGPLTTLAPTGSALAAPAAGAGQPAPAWLPGR